MKAARIKDLLVELEDAIALAELAAANREDSPTGVRLLQEVATMERQRELLDRLLAEWPA